MRVKEPLCRAAIAVGTDDEIGGTTSSTPPSCREAA
jgi:hypothetical protein